MNKLFKKGLVSLAAASVLATGAMAAVTGIDYNASDDNITGYITTGQPYKVENVILELNLTNTSENKILVKIPKGVKFASNPTVKSENEVFEISGIPARSKSFNSADAVLVDDQYVLVVTLDKNDTNYTNNTIVIEDLDLEIADAQTFFGDSSSKELNVTVEGDTYVKDYVAAEAVKDLKDYDINGTNGASLPNVKPSGHIEANSSDDKTISLLLNIPADTPADSTVVITLPSGVDINSSKVSPTILTDAKDQDLADINKVDTNLTHTAETTNNVITFTVGSTTPLDTQAKIDFNLSDITTSGLNDGDAIKATISGTANATFITGANEVQFATAKKAGVYAEANTTVADELPKITIGASNAGELTDFNLSEAFSNDINGSGQIKLTLGGGAIFAAGVGFNGNSDFNVSNYTGETSELTLDINSSAVKPTSTDQWQFKDLNITVPEGTDAGDITLTISKADTGTNNTITESTITVAKAVEGSVSVDTNETGKKIGIGGTANVYLYINESTYGSLRPTNNGAYDKVYITLTNATFDGNLNDSSVYNNGGNELNLTKVATITSTEALYEIKAESSINDSNLSNVYIPLTIKADSTLSVGDTVTASLRHQDGTEFGSVTLATVDYAGVVTAVEHNVTEIGSAQEQTLGKINIKENFSGALGTSGTGVISLIAPAGVSITDTVIEGNKIDSNETGGLNNRILVLNLDLSSDIDANVTIKGYIDNSVAEGPINFEVVDYNATGDSTESNVSIKTESALPVSYATTDGTIPAPTLTASTTTATPGSSVEFTCTGTGLGTLALATSNSDYTVDGMTVTVPETAVDSETVDVTCTETLGGKTATSEATTITVAAAPTTVTKSYTINNGWNFFVAPKDFTADDFKALVGSHQAVIWTQTESGEWQNYYNGSTTAGAKEIGDVKAGQVMIINSGEAFNFDVEAPADVSYSPICPTGAVGVYQWSGTSSEVTFEELQSKCGQDISVWNVDATGNWTNRYYYNEALGTSTNASGEFTSAPAETVLAITKTK